MPLLSVSRHRWFDVLPLPSQRPPAEVAGWLLDSGSLTTRLIRASAGDFAVQLLQQGWVRPSVDEARLLGLPPHQVAWVRETALRCHGEAWVYARSVMPLATLNGELRYLQRLKNASLGALLFRDPTLRRSRFQIARLDLSSLPCERLGVTPTQASVWGRRSLFQFHGRPLLVGEIFLPAFRPE